MTRRGDRTGHISWAAELRKRREGDAKETCWLLVLDRAVCVESSLDVSGDINDNAHSGVRRMQLVFDDDEAYLRYKDFVGRRVLATGGVFEAQTGHHHTELLLTINDLARAPRSAPSSSTK